MVKAVALGRDFRFFFFPPLYALYCLNFFFFQECIPEMYGQKLMCDKINEWEKAWCIVGIQDYLLNK